MIILRVLYETPNCAESCSDKESYELLLREIKEETSYAPEFKSFRETKINLLEEEKENNDQKQQVCNNFPLILFTRLKIS